MTTNARTYAHGIRTWRAAMAGVAVGVLGIVTAGTASAAPGPVLQNADLVCGATTLTTNDMTTDWVAKGGDSLWVFTGELAGHYSILTDTHYRFDGYRREPMDSYQGLPMIRTKTWGAKTGLTDPVSCDFVSRWGEEGAPGTFSVVGPLTMVRIQ